MPHGGNTQLGKCLTNAFVEAAGGGGGVLLLVHLELTEP